MKITNYSSEQEKISYEIASNPELQKSELAPKAKKVCWHEQIYKTLATGGDFSCFVLYFDENYDPTRTINKLRKGRNAVAGSTADSMFHEVPYNVSFGLYAFTASIDENLQIVEQITPYFTPEFIISLNMNTIHDKVDIPITLSNVSIQEEYEGNFLNRRFITTTFEFLAKSYVYGPITPRKIIEGITAEFRSDLTGTGGGGGDFLLQSFGITGNATTGVSGPIFTPAQGFSK